MVTEEEIDDQFWENLRRRDPNQWKELTKISASFLPQPIVPCPEEDDDPAPRNCVWASLIGLVLGIVLGAFGARLLP